MIGKNLFCILVAACLTAACQKASKTQTERSETSDSNPVEDQAQVPLGLPEQINITDKLGRVLEVKIVGRDSQEIQFIRLSDNKFFRWKIAQLSEADQKIIERLPLINGPSDQVSAVGDHLSVENRAKEIARINKEIELLEKELPGMLENASKGISPRAKGLEKKITTLKEVVIQLETEIAILKNQ